MERHLKLFCIFGYKRTIKCFFYLSTKLAPASGIDRVKVNGNSLSNWDKLSIRDTGKAQHLPTGDKLWLVSVLVGVVNNFLDSRLDDHLCAFVAWKQGHVDLAAFHVGRILLEEKFIKVT